MVKRIKRLSYYFITFAILILLAFILLCNFNKTESFLLLNSYHSLFLDTCFKLLTHLGDGLICILFTLIFLILKKKKKALTLLLAYTSSSIIAQATKRIIDLPRPKLLFDQLDIVYPNFVSGVNLHEHHSFPSGHTTSAFVLATVLVLAFKKKRISIACILLASIVGYSRIYLAQHFLIDVVVGAILGVSCALLSYYQVYDLKLFRSKKVLRRFKKLNTAANHPI